MELWDAYDREGDLLGYDLVRGKPFPEGAYHLVAEVYSVTADGRILVTRRHPDKTCGGLWEITGGSVVKGESALHAARRELEEETGIRVGEADLRPFCVTRRHYPGGYPTIQHSFLTVFDPAEQTIRLQPGETVDWRLLTYSEFLRLLMTEDYMPSLRQRFLENRERFEELLRGAGIDGKRDDHGND